MIFRMRLKGKKSEGGTRSSTSGILAMRQATRERGAFCPPLLTCASVKWGANAGVMWDICSAGCGLFTFSIANNMKRGMRRLLTTH